MLDVTNSTELSAGTAPKSKGMAPPSPDKPPPIAALAGEAPASLRTWIGVCGSTLGAFMAILNIQITNASLADIQGGIGAGIDDGGWVSTSYLIGEIVVIPLTDFLSRVFSLRRFLITMAALFLIFSAACAFAGNLQQMIVLRALQGFSGGVLIPAGMTVILTKLPKFQQPIGLSLFAISIVFAPAIGPTIGGYLTENYGWEAVFFINLVPGSVMLVSLIATLDAAPLQLALLRQGDWSAIAAMAVGLGTLQTVLEEGNKDDWFGSPFIVRLSIIAAISLTIFIVIELTRKNPLVDLRLLLLRNFGFGTAANTCFGVGLYGSVFVLPLYLSQVQGYNSEQIGEVMAWVGLPQLLVIPFVPRLMRKIDPRWLVSGGFLFFGLSSFLNIHMSDNYAGDQFFLPNIVRALGQSVVMAPLTVLAMSGMARENAGAASGLFNMTRNLGGAFGTAMLQTLLTKREQFHSVVINNHVTLLDRGTTQRVGALQQHFMTRGVTDPALAWHKAVTMVGRLVHHEALIMAYSDAFAAIGFSVLMAGLCVLCMRKAAGPGPAGAH